MHEDGSHRYDAAKAAVLSEQVLRPLMEALIRWTPG
jgi:hypothetical protein